MKKKIQLPFQGNSFLSITLIKWKFFYLITLLVFINCPLKGQSELFKYRSQFSPEVYNYLVKMFTQTSRSNRRYLISEPYLDIISLNKLDSLSGNSVADTAKPELLISKTIFHELINIRYNRQNLLTEYKLNNDTAFPIVGVKIKPIRRELKKTKKRIISNLSIKELVPIKSYVNSFFPIKSLPRLTKNQNYTEYKFAEALIDGVTDFLLKISANQKDNYKVSLFLKTEPLMATVTLSAANSKPIVGLSNNPINNIFRGLYKYKVSLLGYHTITGEINLVDDPGTTFHCTFINLTNSKKGILPCYLKDH